MAETKRNLKNGTTCFEFGAIPNNNIENNDQPGLVYLTPLERELYEKYRAKNPSATEGDFLKKRNSVKGGQTSHVIAGGCVFPVGTTRAELAHLNEARRETYDGKDRY